MERLEKRVNELKITDFDNFPVWTWAEDEDESLVKPIDCSQVLPEEYDALFVRAELCLQDKTRIPGVLSVRMRDMVVYLISFSRDDGTLVDFLVHSPLENKFRAQIAAWLDKPVDQVFPIMYGTPCTFRDSRQIAGQIV